MALIDSTGYSPYLQDSTRNWVEAVGRVDGKINPVLHLRLATDVNYIKNAPAKIYAGNTTKTYQTKSMMNIGLPGQRIPGITSWNVTESLDTITQSASFEAINCLPVSEKYTTLQTALPASYHSLTVIDTYYNEPSFGVVTRHGGNTRPPVGEEEVKYRVFADQQFTVASSAGFPNPLMPNDTDGQELKDDMYFPGVSNVGTGAYYILIDNEVVRVINLSGNVFTIPPGGRAVNGVLESHDIGARATLLGFGPTTGDWTAMGYLNVDDYNPQSALLRPGTCLVSYEGYGNVSGLLSRTYNPASNYTFTGYWFVRGIEPSLGEDGVPRIRVDLASAGRMFEGQSISPDILRRVKTKFGQWRVGQNNATIWGAADHDRDIPGDWVDYNEWDPVEARATSLTISTELAQHKAFFDHMRDTDKGLRCLDCRRERKEWLRTHENPDDLRRSWNAMPSGAPKEALGKRIADLELQMARHIGRHIYKGSIRVLQAEAGPIKTYIRLMGTIAAAAWDHPAYGNELAQRFTKIPGRLYNNIRNIGTGLVYNGQLDFDLETRDPNYDWFTPAFDDKKIVSRRKTLSCPFTVTYDRAPFSQPMVDLAAVNDATFWVNREGYPVFIPKTFSCRPNGRGFRDLAKTIQYPAENGEWFLSYGGSISSYSHSINSDAVMTQCWVTAESAFEGSSITVVAAGTGFKDDGTRVNYGGFGGNKLGLALTSGVQQPDSITMDNVVLGLEWNTNVAAWGMKMETENGTTVLNAVPPLFDGSPVLQKGIQGHERAIKRVQKLINFFMMRRYLPDIVHSGGRVARWPIPETGDYNDMTHEGVVNLQQFLRNTANLPLADRPSDISNMPADGRYGRHTYLWTRKFLDIAKHYIKFDIWWYVTNDRFWEEYLAAITGIPVPYKANKKKTSSRTKKKTFDADASNWVIDDKGLQEEIEKWLKEFSQQAINAGNRAVNESIDKATVRSIQCNLADPRIQPGDTIWCEIPGHLGSRDAKGRARPPFTNGIYVQTITRSMTLEGANRSYTAAYSGHRARGDFNNTETASLNNGWDFIS